MTTETYEGWVNRETWATYLWLSNDEVLYNEALEVAKQEFDYNHQRDDAMKELVELLHDQSLMRNDIGSLWRVDWTEIVEAFKEE